MADKLTVLVDPAAANGDKQRELISKACTDIGVKCDFVGQIFEKTISWVAPLSASSTVRDDISKEILAVLYAEEVIQMIHNYLQSKPGETQQMTITKWVKSIQEGLRGHNITVLVVGLNQFFSKQKLKTKRNFREAVAGEAALKRKKQTKVDLSITYQDAEEAFVELQLFTGCVVQHAATDEELASQIKYFTKAVLDKPSKKDRMDNALSFLDESSGRVFVNKQGQGLNKVWKNQLMQFKNFGPEMSEAITTVYPSPYLLHKACTESCEKEAEKLIADINVRRNASVISTNRKIGKEHARRIYTFMTSKDPNQIIK